MSELECLYAERATIAEGAYTYRATRWTRALLGRDESDMYLILLAGVDESLDDQSAIQEWIKPRPLRILRPATRHRAIRIAVEDANTWRDHVHTLMPTFPRRDIKDWREVKP